MWKKIWINNIFMAVFWKGTFYVLRNTRVSFLKELLKVNRKSDAEGSIANYIQQWRDRSHWKEPTVHYDVIYVSMALAYDITLKDFSIRRPIYTMKRTITFSS